MQSIFPGMDPYLEDPALWPDFQRIFLESLRVVLQAAIPDIYTIDVAAPCIEIRNHRLVTMLHVTSPECKLTGAGRDAALRTWNAAKDAGVNAVEIDVVLQGQPVLDYSREGLPPWQYAVSVCRAVQPDRFEIYTATLRKRLPRFRLPLAGEDRDAVVDVQLVFAGSFARGGFAERIDYRREPAVPLTDDDRRWLSARLQDIAVAAYYIWEREGRPVGRHKEHWNRAVEGLKRG